jgi:hypothetical protein
MIDLSKTYKTKRGDKVELDTIKYGRVWGRVFINNEWVSSSWYLESGKSASLRYDYNQFTLIEVKPKHVLWVNIYPKGITDAFYRNVHKSSHTDIIDNLLSAFSTREEADMYANKDKRLACIRLEFTEGERNN